MSLPTRKIGKSDVPYPGLGAMGMSAWYGTAGNDEKHIAVLKAAYDAGARFWDTADIYGDNGMGENERLIAKAMKETHIPRKDIFLATKFGGVNREGQMVIDGRPEYVKQAIEKSLAALDTDYIDLYYQHRIDRNVPVEETVKAMKELQDAGKIRYIGLSECSADTLRRASKIAKIDAVQMEYSIWETHIETDGLLDACKELGVALVAYSPLGRGFLTGKIKSRANLSPTDGRLYFPRFSEENFGKNLELVDEIRKLAEKKGCAPSQLALAWVHAQWEGILAIPGTTRLEGLKENIGSVHVSLTKNELAEIRKTLESFEIQGLRYHESLMGSLNV